MPRGHILDLRWNALLNDFRRSGLTQAEFCRRRGISIHSFRKRLYQRTHPEADPREPLSSDAPPPTSSPSPSSPIPSPPPRPPDSPSN